MVGVREMEWEREMVRDRDREKVGERGCEGERKSNREMVWDRERESE